MSDIIWLPGVTIPMDPDATLDYSMDFADWLDDDTIASAAVAAENCVAEMRGTPTTTGVVFRVSAVQLGAKVTLQLTTASGQYDEFSVRFRSVNK